MAAAALHTLADGNVLCVMKASELITIPIWKGNRILDMAHVAEISAEVGDEIEKLDFCYRIINIPETDCTGRHIMGRYVIDGQHRLSVLTRVFHTSVRDFDVIILKKDVKDESDAISYFRTLNKTKIIDYDDENLQCNKYIEHLMNIFNTSRQLIRHGATKRPYLSVDKLREALLVHKTYFSSDIDQIKLFVAHAVIENEKGILHREIELALNTNKTKTIANILESAIERKFVLAIDPKLQWIGEIFREIRSLSNI